MALKRKYINAKDLDSYVLYIAHTQNPKESM